MHSRDINPSSIRQRSWLPGAAIALLAATLSISAPLAQAAPGAGASNHARIILQHHPHRHAAGMRHGSQDSNSSKIILQHHPHAHAAGPGRGGKNPANSKIILQHHPRSH